MERKSIGQFIMALRKANGMTQKQLAEKLNVSDKAVSRWERDENAPDITLIPVLAEIFGVTSDEILLGERRIRQEASESPTLNNGRFDKQVERLLNSTYTRFSISSTIAMGIGILGLLAAMVCNFGFYRAYIGFFLATALYLAAGISEIIFTKIAYSSLEGSEFACEKRNSFKRKIFHTSCRTCMLLLTFLFISFPLLILPWDSYMGITLDSWFAHGLVFLGISILLCAIISWAANRFAISQKIYMPTENDSENQKKIEKLKKKSIAILAILLAVTAIGQAAYNMLAPRMFLTGRTFTDFDEFKTYIETPSKKYAEFEEHNITYYDEYGNEISEEEALTGEIYSADGETLVGQYLFRNKDIVRIDYHWNGDSLEIVAYTGEQALQKDRLIQTVNKCWIALYIAEILAAMAIYHQKKRKLISPSEISIN